MKCLLILLGLWLGAPILLSAAPASVVVFAAASLTDALGELVGRYQAEGRGSVTTSFASSSDLARQIEQGAPVDLFISADEEWADYLDQRGLLDKPSRQVLVTNELVLVAPAANPVALEIKANFPLAAALGDGRLAVGDPDHVPAGIYAKQALGHLGVWDALEPKLARAASVRAALTFVERGECPLGIVYRSDALHDEKIRIVATFPPASHAPVTYPIALVAGRKSPESVDFLHYLQAPEALATFRRYGFGQGS
jgi:molybdate transport system substrate-binding protein